MKQTLNWLRGKQKKEKRRQTHINFIITYVELNIDGAIDKRLNIPNGIENKLQREYFGAERAVKMIRYGKKKKTP